MWQPQIVMCRKSAPQLNFPESNNFQMPKPLSTPPPPQNCNEVGIVALWLHQAPPVFMRSGLDNKSVIAKRFVGFFVAHPLCCALPEGWVFTEGYG